MTPDNDFLAVQIVTDNVRLRLGDDRAHGTLHTPLFDVVSKALGCADVKDASRNVYAWQTFLDDRASALRFCELHLFQAERFKS